MNEEFSVVNIVQQSFAHELPEPVSGSLLRSIESIRDCDGKNNADAHLLVMRLSIASSASLLFRLQDRFQRTTHAACRTLQVHDKRLSLDQRETICRTWANERPCRTEVYFDATLKAMAQGIDVDSSKSDTPFCFAPKSDGMQQPQDIIGQNHNHEPEPELQHRQAAHASLPDNNSPTFELVPVADQHHQATDESNRPRVTIKPSEVEIPDSPADGEEENTQQHTQEMDNATHKDANALQYRACNRKLDHRVLLLPQFQTLLYTIAASIDTVESDLENRHARNNADREDNQSAEILLAKYTLRECMTEKQMMDRSLTELQQEHVDNRGPDPIDSKPNLEEPQRGYFNSIRVFHSERSHIRAQQPLPTFGDIAMERLERNPATSES